MDHLPLCSRLPEEKTFELKALKMGPPESPCMEISKEFHFSELAEEYLQYLSQSSMSYSHKGNNTAVERHGQLTTKFTPDDRNSSLSRNTLHPTPKPSTLPPPPPPPPLPFISIVLPVEAFSFPSAKTFEFNETDCQCPDACHETTYTLTEQKMISPLGFNECLVSLILTFDFTEELLEESLAITLPDLIAGVGGNIGLFTGFSLFTLVELFGTFLRRVPDKMRGWSCGRAENETPKETKKRMNEVNPNVNIAKTQEGDGMEMLDL